MFHKGCTFREWAVSALDAIGRSHRIAYVSPSIAGIQAAMAAGLAVAPIGLSAVPHGARLLTPDMGFPALPTARLMLRRNPESRSPAVNCLAEHMAEGFRENQAVLP